MRAENAGYTNYAEIGNIISENIGFTNTPAMIGATSNNLIGAVVINEAASNFKGRILEFRIYQGAPAPLDAAVPGEGAIWNQVPITPSLQNWRLGASVPLIGDAAFFRLHAP
ncbi:MAG: hypothetical protein ABSE48_22455 [Verrucomicrobiota bacterium]